MTPFRLMAPVEKQVEFLLRYAGSTSVPTGTLGIKLKQKVIEVDDQSIELQVSSPLLAFLHQIINIGLTPSYLSTSLDMAQRPS